MERSDQPPISDELREYFRQQGSIGGKQGGKDRWKKVSKAKRSQIMRQVAAQRKNPGRKPKPTKQDSNP